VGADLGIVGVIDSWRALRDLTEQRPGRVIVYGRSPQRWVEALSPGAPVWSGLAGLSEVVLARTSFELLCLGHRGGRQSIVIPMLERNEMRCPRLYWGLLPGREAVLLLGDKARFAGYAEAQGLGAHVPRRFVDPHAARFPCVVKRVDLQGGEGVSVARSAAQLAYLVESEPWRGRSVVLQAFIEPGEDHVTHCVCRNGRILWHRTYRYALKPGTEVQTADSVVAVRELEETAQNLALFECFLVPLGYDGPVNIDTRRHDGRTTVLEINPRLGGSLMRPENVADLRAALAALIGNAAPMWRRSEAQ
jgi:hypothetical protein